MPTTEIDPEVDYDFRRAVYFRQMRYGLFVRYNRRHRTMPHLMVIIDPHGSLSKRDGVKNISKKAKLCQPKDLNGPHILLC